VTTFVAFLVEAFGTGVLAFVVFALTNKRNSVMQGSGFVPPLIGMTVGALIAVLAPLTQGGYNPGMFCLSARFNAKGCGRRHRTHDLYHVHHSVYFLDNPPNVARDFGPRIVAFLAGWKTVAFQGWWVYVVAPVVGATVGAFLAEKVLYADE